MMGSPGADITSPAEGQTLCRIRRTARPDLGWPTRFYDRIIATNANDSKYVIERLAVTPP